MKKYLNGIAIIATLTIFHNSTAAQSYFPLDLETTWTYDLNNYATSDTNRTDLEAMVSGKQQREEWGSSEVTYKVRRDSVVNGQTYKIITNTKDPFEIDLVREENGNYFRLNDNTFKEENFLKTAVKQGDLWLDYENAEQTIATIYVIISVDKTKKIKGKIYNDVIGIGQVTASVEQLMAYLQEDNAFMPTKFYAKNIGLVYSYIPYPLGNTYADTEMVIKK